MKIDKAVIEKAKAEHGEVYALSASGREVLVRMPTSPEWAAFMDKREELGGHRALRQLLADCMLFPDEAGWQAMVDARPALGKVFSERLFVLAGAAEEATAKKL